MRKHLRFAVLGLAAASAAVALTGCKTLEAVAEAGAEIGVASGAITTNQARSIVRSSQAVSKTFADITPEQEYYIGRAVAAELLQRYPVYENTEATRYVNLVGRSVSLVSERPETYGGYHFIILDSDEVNAFAAPGGLIMVTRGMLRCCPTEDALAAVLAHEVGHVQHRDGLRSIKKSRLTSALTTLAAEGARQLGDDYVAQLADDLEGSVGDVMNTLVTEGYARRLEKQADLAAVRMLNQVGYDANGLAAMLREMDRRMPPGSGGFGHTHPRPLDRLKLVERALAGPGAATPPARQARFQEFLGNL